MTTDTQPSGTVYGGQSNDDRRSEMLAAALDAHVHGAGFLMFMPDNSVHYIPIDAVKIDASKLPEGAVPGDRVVTSDSGGSTCEFCGLWIPPDQNYCMHGLDWFDLQGATS